MQFQLFEKLTSASQFQIEWENPYDNMKKIRAEKVPEDVSWSGFFSHLRTHFSEFPYKIFSLLYMISLAFKISHCISANHNPELRCVICTGVTLSALVFCTSVTLFALVLHLNCTALSQSESGNFFIYIIRVINRWLKGVSF